MSDIRKAHQVLQGNGYFTLRLTGECDYANSKGVEEELKALIIDPYPHMIINCEHVGSLSKDWLRILLSLQFELKKYNRSMRFIQAQPNLLITLKKQGMDTAFKSSPTLRDALVEFGLITKKALDTDFINPFLNATMHVLKVQARVTVSPGKIFLKKEKSFVGDISGVIGIISSTFNGSVVISFPEKTFLNVMSSMMEEEYLSLSKEIIDGAGELTNMIFGQAKVSLNEKGYGIKTAIPSVVAGKDHSLTSLSTGPTVVVPFTSDKGEFFIEICLSA